MRPGCDASGASDQDFSMFIHVASHPSGAKVILRHSEYEPEAQNPKRFLVALAIGRIFR